MQLFDLRTDPEEAHNLAAEHPKRIAQMMQILEQDIQRGRSTPGPVLKNDRNVNPFARIPKFSLNP